MTATGYSVDVYLQWDFIPVVIITAVLGAGSLGLILPNTFLSSCNPGHRLLCEDIIFGVTRMVLDFEVTNDQQGNKVAIFHGRKIPAGTINLFFPFAVGIWMCACVTFWVIFLVEETFGCDPGLDCFPRQDNNSELLSHTPIQNCSDYDLIDNVTIVCYSFVFRYAEGVGAAGGVLVFAALFMKMYETTLFWVVDSPVTVDGWGITKIIMKALFGTLIFAPGLIIFLLVYIGSAGLSRYLPLISDTITNTKSGTAQFFSYLVTIAYMSTIGTYDLHKITKLDKLGAPKDITERTPLVNGTKK